jgi:arsenite methyltransferase
VLTNDEHLRAEVSARYARTALLVLLTEQLTSADACCAPSYCSPTAAAPADIRKALPICGRASTDCGVLRVELLFCQNVGRKCHYVRSLQPGRDRNHPGGGRTGVGLDMTDAMLALAERHRAEAGVENVGFLRGIIEDIPLPPESVDVVISNCVVNLSMDKGQVLHAAHRVLAPGGQFAVLDIVFQGSIPQTLRTDLDAWASCIAGALEEGNYQELLREAGFTDIEVEETRRYSLVEIVGSKASDSIAALSPN